MREPRTLDILEHPSPNFNERTRPIRFVMLHYTGMKSADGARRVLSDPAPVRGNYAGLIKWPEPDMAGLLALPEPPPPPPPIPMGRVSSHYLVYEDGRIYRLVDESKRAWHAGGGAWQGETDMNSASVGIEIANGGHDFGLPEYPEEQVVAVFALVRQILARHGLPPTQVIGHSDWAPSRKPDPGERFPWKRMAEAGLAVWPVPGSGDGDRTLLVGQDGSTDPVVAQMQARLATIGYGIAQSGVFDAATRDVIRAFQRRFRQDRVDALIDVETFALAERVGQVLRAPTA